jgi:hypothetical protein
VPDDLRAPEDAKRRVHEPGPPALARLRLHADASPFRIEADQLGNADATGYLMPPVWTGAWLDRELLMPREEPAAPGIERLASCQAVARVVGSKGTSPSRRTPGNAAV